MGGGVCTFISSPQQFVVTSRVASKAAGLSPPAARQTDWRHTMLIKQAPDIRSSEITDERLYRTRRQFIRAASGAAMGVVAGATVVVGVAVVVV